MAWSPSSRAPRAADVLTPQAAELPTDELLRDGVLSGRAFISLGEELFRQTPVRDVRLVAVQPFLSELARCPHLSELRRLDLTGNRIGDAGLQELAASPFLGGLRELGLSGNNLTANPRVENLTVLEIADNRLTAPPDMVCITTLDVSRNPLRSFVFPVALQRLKASGCGLPVESLRSLQHLVELDASFNALGTAGVEALSELPARWRRLDLSFNGIESVESLAFADSVSSLVSLNLSANRIDSTAALAESPNLGAVEELILAANPIGDRGAVGLLRGEAFSNLMRLDLSNCGITDVAGLCATGALGGLRSLSLAWNPFGDARPLARCPDLAGLQELDLGGTRLDFAGAVALVESPHLANLRCLKLGENPRLPIDAVGMLQERFGTITA